MKSQRMKTKGFTLIELLVVIAIIALLMAVMMPALSAVKKRAELIVCGSNQKQLLTGVITYAAGNDGKFPPAVHSIPGGATLGDIPDYLNYRYGTQPEQIVGMYQYLGSYLPQVDVFLCPLGPKVDENKWQEKYADYNESGVNPWGGYPGSPMVSYNFYWGGVDLGGVNGSESGKTFVGPKKQSDKNVKLMVSDTMLDWLDDNWAVSHEDKLDSVQGWEQDPVYGNDFSALWIAQTAAKPKGLKFNAGYIDGHVERYDSDDTDAFALTGQMSQYIPLKWR